MIFKCKNCSGNVIYSPEKKGMYCPFCNSSDSEERQDSRGDMKICPNCSGEVPVEEHTSATQCPYCDSYIIVNERVEAQYAPQLILPFQLSREMVKTSLKEKFKKYVFAPADFLSEVRLNTMEGIYVPFWLYDYDVNCQYQGEGSRVRHWTTGEMEYTEISYFNISRDMDVPFQKIPVDASVKMDDAIMDLMEPYGYDTMVPFRPEFMSGFSGEKYNCAWDILEPRARQKMEEDVNALLQQTISGYGSVRQIHRNVNVKQQQNNYGLLPVWKYTYEYKNKSYPFHINGQTGKIVGKLPVSVGKVWAYGVTIWAFLAALMGMARGILSILM